MGFNDGLIGLYECYHTKERISKTNRLLILVLMDVKIYVLFDGGHQ